MISRHSTYIGKSRKQNPKITQRHSRKQNPVYLSERIIVIWGQIELERAVEIADVGKLKLEYLKLNWEE